MTILERKNANVSIIVAALLPSLGIGMNGKMPWRLRLEMKYFKEVTTNTSDPKYINAVVMGRKTWESIPKKFRPLDNRINVILSRNTANIKDSIDDNGVLFASSLEDALDQLHSNEKIVEKIFIVGGAEIYNEYVNNDLVKHILLTEIESDTPVELDTWLKFPLYAPTTLWTKQSHNELENFTGLKHEEDPITEGDFKYHYTYWKKK